MNISNNCISVELSITKLQNDNNLSRFYWCTIVISTSFFPARAGLNFINSNHIRSRGSQFHVRFWHASWCSCQVKIRCWSIRIALYHSRKQNFFVTRKKKIFAFIFDTCISSKVINLIMTKKTRSFTIAFFFIWLRKLNK